MPKVSVVVPCYGVEKYLDRCLQSLVNQTLKDIEIILVDDKSPDKVPEMCDDWAIKDSRIKVIHKDVNQGLGFARNSGLEVATGDYVAFVDSDDYVDEDAFMIYYSHTNEGVVDIVSAGINREDSIGVWRKYRESDAIVVLNHDQAWQYAKDMVASLPNEKCERNNNMSVWHAIYKRSIIEQYNILFFSEREVNSEDIPFQLDYFKCVNSVVLLPDCLYYYCLNQNSLTTTFKPEKFNKYIYLRSILLKKMEGDDEATDRANRFFIGYARSFTLQLLNSDRKDKFNILRHILNNQIWIEVGLNYSPSNLPLYQSILYWLQLHRIWWLIFPYLRIASVFKSSR